MHFLTGIFGGYALVTYIIWLLVTFTIISPDIITIGVHDLFIHFLLAGIGYILTKIYHRLGEK